MLLTQKDERVLIWFLRFNILINSFYYSWVSSRWSGYGVIKSSRAHFWCQSHFYNCNSSKVRLRPKVSSSYFHGLGAWSQERNWQRMFPSTCKCYTPNKVENTWVVSEKQLFKYEQMTVTDWQWSQQVAGATQMTGSVYWFVTSTKWIATHCSICAVYIFNKQ